MSRVTAGAGHLAVAGPGPVPRSANGLAAVQEEKKLGILPLCKTDSQSVPYTCGTCGSLPREAVAAVCIQEEFSAGADGALSPRTIQTYCVPWYLCKNDFEYVLCNYCRPQVVDNICAPDFRGQHKEAS